MMKKIKENRYLIGIIGLLLVIALFLIIKIILNVMGYDLLGWIYYALLFVVNVFLIAYSLIYINKHQVKKEGIPMSIFLLIIEVPLCLIASSLISIVFHFHHEEIITIGNEKYIRSYDAFELHPKPDYYEYINPFIRKQEQLNYNLEMDSSIQ